MPNNTLLQHIWSRKISVPDRSEVSPLASMLETLLPTKVVTLVQEDCHADSYALMESTTLLPNVSLGDVLAEELDLHVPKETVILIEPSHIANAKEYNLREQGNALGRILIHLACEQGQPIAARLQDSQTAANAIKEPAAEAIHLMAAQ